MNHANQGPSRQPPQTMIQGLEHAGRGEFQAAAELFQAAAAEAPNLAEAHYNLGNAFRKLNDNAAAVEAFSRAAESVPNWPEAQFNLANALRDSGEIDRAIEHFRRAVELKPDYARALQNLGNLLRRRGMLEEAAGRYQKLAELQPGSARAHSQLAGVLEDLGRRDPALHHRRRAAECEPNSPERRLQLAAALSRKSLYREAEAHLRAAIELAPQSAAPREHLGEVLKNRREFDQAEQVLRQALELEPDSAGALRRLGDVLRLAGRPQEGVEQLERAVQLEPDSALGHNLLGMALMAAGQPGEAVASYRRALEINPSLPDAHNNLGAALQSLGQIEEGLVSLETALRLKPAFAVARMNRALTALRRGDWPTGWLEFEWRRQSRDHRVPGFGRPLWDGGPLAGKTILLIGEQGLGDTIQFVRLAPLVKERGGRVLLLCQKPLAHLLAGAEGVDQLIPRGERMPKFDVQAPLMSLPGLLGLTRESLPAPEKYLAAEPERAARWREELAALPGKVHVGVCWQGNRKYQGDHFRSIPLAEFEPLAQVAGVTLVSLQKGDGSEQRGEVEFQVVDFGERLDADAPFADTAAILSELDLLVTSDTAVAHLAGALGAPTWLPLSRAADWRWEASGERSIWYPSMRLFRQRELGDWGDVFARMASGLGQVVGGKPPIELAGDDRVVAAESDAEARPAPPPGNESGSASLGSGFAAEVVVPVSPGELLDKITILEIKAERFTDEAKLANVRRELSRLREQAERLNNADLPRLTAELRKVNEQLWEVEDDIRRCEAEGDFGPRFIELARSVYRLNDHRAAVKREINLALGSELVEEKGYAEWQGER